MNQDADYVTVVEDSPITFRAEYPQSGDGANFRLRRMIGAGAL